MSLIWFTLSAVIVLNPAIAQVATSGPILRTERETTETARTVAADQYRDAYCEKWTDGCLVCQRTTADEQPTCQSATGSQAACEKKPVQCQAVLKTVGRVCLSYSDGCNRCTGGYCTAMACPMRLPDGTSRQKEADYQCTVPRRALYDTSQWLELDLWGNWRVVDPRGHSCEIVIRGGDVSLSAKCVDLGSPLTEARQAKATISIFQLLRSDGRPILTFETSNLESLTGIRESSGFRLMRLEPEPVDFSTWEGLWTLRSSTSCNLFLSMRTHRISPHVEIKVPHEVSFASRCLMPTDDNTIQFKNLRSVPMTGGAEGHRRTRVVVDDPVHVPRWTSWQVEAHDITFYDQNGRPTTFKRDREGRWAAELPQTGHPPMIVYLSRQRR